MELTNVVLICIICAVLSLMLRQYKPEFAMVLSMVCGIIVILYLLQGFADIRAQLDALLSGINLPQGLPEAVFKGLGICVLTELAAQSCRDAGESAIALKVELAGKVAVVLIAMPLFLRLLQLSAELLAAAS